MLETVSNAHSFAPFYKPRLRRIDVDSGVGTGPGSNGGAGADSDGDRCGDRSGTHRSSGEYRATILQEAQGVRGLPANCRQLGLRTILVVP